MATVSVIRVVLVVAGFVAALALLYALRTLLIVLLFSVLFAYLVDPLVRFIQQGTGARRRRQLPRGAAIGVAYLLLFGALGLWLAWLTPHVTEAVKQLPDRIRTGNPSAQLGALADRLPGRFGASDELIDRALSTVTGTIEVGIHYAATALVHAAASLPWLVLIPILGFFLLKDAEALTRAAICLVPARWRPRAPAVAGRIDAALASYIRAQLLACLIVGAIVAGGFAALRIPFAAVLGVFAGFAEFLPLVGPLAFAVVSAVVVAALRAPIDILWVLLFLGVLRLAQDYVIYPRLIGSSVHLHPLAVILAVLAGGELGGVVGVFLSVPVLAIATVLYRHRAEWQDAETEAPSPAGVRS